jgi:hypothetical protein
MEATNKDDDLFNLVDCSVSYLQAFTTLLWVSTPICCSWSAFNWAIDEVIYFKFERLDKTSSRSAFNWVINVGNFCKLLHFAK